MVHNWIMRTRVQIFLGFSFAMIFVLAITISISYFSVSKVLLKNADSYTQEIAGQMNGRLDALFEQVDTLSLQLVSDERIQKIIDSSNQGKSITVDEQLYEIRPMLVRTASYSRLIKSIDLYSRSKTLYPMGDTPLSERIDPKWIREADRQAGKFVWIGLDPSDRTTLLGIRQIRMEKENYRGGGYLVVSLTSSLLDFIEGGVANIEGSLVFLLNQQDEIISSRKRPNLSVNSELLSSGEDIVEIEGNSYTKVSMTEPMTGWTAVVLLPLKKVKEGISVLNSVMVLASVVGLILFFVCAYILSTLTTKPLRKLTRVMKRTRNMVFEPNEEVYSNLEINDLNITYNKMVHNINDLIEEGYKKEMAKMQSEIKALHAQLNPHFLFNTLEAFYWQLIESGQQKLAKQVISLANLFRYSIRKESDHDFVSLGTEMGHVRNYLQLMKMRMGSRLDWEIYMDPDLADISIPKLSIQPLVENSILHGIEANTSEGKLYVSVSRSEADHGIIVAVKDNGIGMDEAALERLRTKLNSETGIESGKGGIGLYNVHHLIRIYYGADYGVEIKHSGPEGTLIHIHLPGGGILE